MSDNPIITGSLPPFPNPDIITFTRRIGYTVESSSLVLIKDRKAFTDVLEANDLSYHVEPHTGTPYCLVSWRPMDINDIIADTWELVGNDLEKDIWELPKVRAEFTKLINAPGTTVDPDNQGNLYYQWHAYVQRVVNGKVNGDEEVPSWYRNTTGDDIGQIHKVKIFTDKDFKGAFDLLNDLAGLPVSGSGAVNYQMFADMAACISRGVSSFPLSSYVVRHTRILPPGTSIRPAINQSNVIFTKAQLLLAHPPPNAIPPEFADSMPDGYYQYKTPTETIERDGTWRYNEEWYWATEFDHFIYGNYGYVGSITTTTAIFT